MASALMGFTTRRWIIDNPFLFGNHRMDGILIAHGRDIRKGQFLPGARLIDVAPTVLHLLGEAIPRDMDGRVLTELFTDGFAASRKIQWRDAAEGPEDETPAEMTPEDEATILEGLKGLGYI